MPGKWKQAVVKEEEKRLSTERNVWHVSSKSRVPVPGKSMQAHGPTSHCHWKVLMDLVLVLCPIL